MKITTAWKSLIFLWIYSGLLRNLFPQINYLLYVLPFLIAVYIFLTNPPLNKSAQGLRTILLIYLITVFGFQVFHFLLQSISLRVLFAGIILYGFAPLIIYIGVNSPAESLLQIFLNLVYFAIPINLIIVLLQVVGNLEFFRYSPLTGAEAMTTDGNVLRAFGTFTHPMGFATFLSVASVTAIYQFNSKSNFLKYFNLFQLGLMYLLSGSRTVFINLSLIFLTFLYLKRKTLKIPGRRKGFSAVIAGCATMFLSFLLIKLQFGWVLESFASRISTASSQENSIDRIFSQSFGWFHNLGDSLWGYGLGSFSSISIGFARDRSTWIEDDLSRNITEAGSLLGAVIILIRWTTPSILRVLVKNSQTQNKELVILIIAAIFSNLTIGPITGQGSVALQVWICISLCLNITKSNSNHL